ncbi:hypothetical protein LGK95_02175 [Clostridium algoriphilum]|nr:hypothetical protein [Clostridium algoriphilum]MCB2292346.1 hypothetical protein [Clostridium algoriphilum]
MSKRTKYTTEQKNEILDAYENGQERISRRIKIGADIFTVEKVIYK